MKWPEGVMGAGGHCGIKHRSPDLAILVADGDVAWAGAFTTNAAAAAPVQWCREHLGAPARAVVVNSGNANACTGADGERAVIATAAELACVLGCSEDQVLVASTGPIGVKLPVGKINSALPGLAEQLTSDVEPFARAILTTDSAIKTVEVSVGEARIVGVAKGAAMIAPRMATMLGFIVTDAKVDGAALQNALSPAVERSFNRLSIDACESTNDSVLALATGRVDVDQAAFAGALEKVCKSLAEQIVRDAEGSTKLMRIRIEGATDEGRAAELGRAVAASDLWRAAVAGADPNWGRVLAALGGVDRALDLSEVELSIGPEMVFHRGEPTGSLDVARKVLGEDEFTLTCVVGDGEGDAEILSADLTKEYVILNSEVTT